MSDKRYIFPYSLIAHRSSLILLAALLTAAPLHAAPKADLEKNKKEISEAKQRQKDIDRENAKLASELAELQRSLVDAAAKVQKGEEELGEAEEKLRVTRRQYEERQAALSERKKRLAAMVQAALKLSRTPPEAVVLMPEDSEKTMVASRALSMTSASIKKEAEAIRQQVAELAVLKQNFEAQRDALKARQRALKDEQKALSSKLSERKKLQAKLGDEARETAERVARLAREAQTLGKLVETIQNAVRGKEAGKEIAMPQSAPQGRKGKLRSFARAKGDIRPPLAGRVVQAYGSTNRKNETHKGITIQARSGARVTAPYDGEVVYAGSFLNYGRMVIIHHSDNFHTLLAGLGEIDTRPGEFLLEGEPIGAMGEGESGARLYLELRKNNQPVDPAPWLND